jgi:hypothetical protein
MYTIDFNAIIAFALVALVIVFIRISWSLKEINDTLASRGAVETKVKVDLAQAKHDAKAASAEAETEDTEIAAVIAIASQAMRG